MSKRRAPSSSSDDEISDRYTFKMPMSKGKAASSSSEEQSPLSPTLMPKRKAKPSSTDEERHISRMLIVHKFNHSAHYHLQIYDLGGKDPVLLKAFEFGKRYPYAMAFAVWESTLYMFGGQYLDEIYVKEAPADENEAPADENEGSADQNERSSDENEGSSDENEGSSEEEDRIIWETDMYSYDLSGMNDFPLLQPSFLHCSSRHNKAWYQLRIEDYVQCPNGSIRKGPKMKAGKHVPIAVVVGDVICVFSRLLYNSTTRDSQFPNFEIFSPTLNSWDELPEPREYSWKDSYAVTSYSVRNSILYISTTDGMCAIDVTKKRWTNLYSGVSRFPFGGGSFFIDNTCFTPFHAWDTAAACGFEDRVQILNGDYLVDYLDDYTIKLKDATISKREGELVLGKVLAGKDYDPSLVTLVHVVDIPRNAEGEIDLSRGIRVVTDYQIESKIIASGNRLQLVTICCCLLY